MVLRSVMAGIVIALSGNAVAAQDLGAGADWAGAYGGLTVGVGTTDGAASRGFFVGWLIERDVAEGLFPERIDSRSAGFAGGAVLGFALQSGPYVAGVEIDGAWVDIDTTARFSRFDPADPLDPNFGSFAGDETNTLYRTRITSLASVRVRLGLAQGRTLVYATGGVAGGRVTNTWGLDLPDFVVPYSNRWSETGTRYGFVVGAGVEQRVSANTILRAEFLHYGLRSVRVRAEDESTFPDEAIEWRFRNNAQMLRVGVNFRF